MAWKNLTVGSCWDHLRAPDDDGFSSLLCSDKNDYLPEIRGYKTDWEPNAGRLQGQQPADSFPSCLITSSGFHARRDPEFPRQLRPLQESIFDSAVLNNWYVFVFHTDWNFNGDFLGIICLQNSSFPVGITDSWNKILLRFVYNLFFFFFSFWRPATQSRLHVY